MIPFRDFIQYNIILIYMPNWLWRNKLRAVLHLHLQFPHVLLVVVVVERANINFNSFKWFSKEKNKKWCQVGLSGAAWKLVGSNIILYIDPIFMLIINKTLFHFFFSPKGQLFEIVRSKIQESGLIPFH